MTSSLMFDTFVSLQLTKCLDGKKVENNVPNDCNSQLVLIFCQPKFLQTNHQGTPKLLYTETRITRLLEFTNKRSAIFSCQRFWTKS